MNAHKNTIIIKRFLRRICISLEYLSLIKNKVEFEIDNLGYDWIDYKEYVKKHKNKVINVVFNTFKDKKIFGGEKNFQFKKGYKILIISVLAFLYTM